MTIDPAHRVGRRPRRRTSRRVHQPPAREVPRHRARASCARPVAEMTFRGGKYAYAMGDGRDGPLADWWLYEDLRGPAHPAVGVRGLRAGRRAGRADDVRRDASRLLPAAARASTTWTSTGSRRRCASRRSRASAARRSSRPHDKELALLCVQAYNDWMVEEWCAGSRRPPVPAVPDPVVGPGARGRRGAPQRGARRARGVLLRAARRSSGCRRCTTPTGTGIRSSPRATRPAPSSACTAARARRCRRPRPTRRRRSSSTLTHELAEGSLADWLFSGLLVRYPERDAHLLRGPDRLDPLHPRPGRPGVGAQPRLERLARPRARAAEHLLLGTRLRLLLRRRRRARGDRRHRPRPGDVRDRLPARRRHLAAQQGGGREALRRPRPTTSCTRSAAATPCASSATSRNFPAHNAPLRRADSARGLQILPMRLKSRIWNAWRFISRAFDPHPPGFPCSFDGRCAMDVRERKLMPQRRRQHQLFTLHRLSKRATRGRRSDGGLAGTWLEVDTTVYRVASGSGRCAASLLTRILAVGGIASGASAAAL